MTKAEERANEKYPLMSEDDKEGLESLKYIGIECDSVYEFNSIRYSQQCYFIEGYQQAEKDLADAFIEKAQLFLIDKLKEIPMGSGKMKIKADYSLEDFIEEFKKAMKL